MVATAVEDHGEQRLHIAFALLRTVVHSKRSISRMVFEAKAANDLHLSESWTTPREEWKEGHPKDLRLGFAALE